MNGLLLDLVMSWTIQLDVLEMKTYASCNAEVLSITPDNVQEFWCITVASRP